jgi:di/tricarboxylate transporter
MSAALLSFSLLIVAIVLGVVKHHLNTGILALAFAYIVGVYVAGMSVKDVAAGMPTDLFLTLVSVLLLFGMVNQNGTLERLAQLSLRASHSHPALLPIIFFALAFMLSAIGPGNIAATALLAPIGMAVAAKANVSSLLMAIMICTGANAGGFSPIAPTGAVNIALMGKIGVTDFGVALFVFFSVAAIQSSSALAAYVLFGGYRTPNHQTIATPLETPLSLRWERPQLATLAIIVALVVGVIIFKAPLSVGAFGLVVGMGLMRLGDVEDSIKTLPWNVILLVTGVTALISIMEKTGGLDVATTLIAWCATPNDINAVLALITGIVSTYSSSSGVVLPVFMTLIPSLMEKTACGNVTEMIIAVGVGSHMVDVSPLSTLGALCLAAASPTVDKAKLFRGLLLWGMAMALVGALLAWVLLDWR